MPADALAQLASVRASKEFSFLPESAGNPLQTRLFHVRLTAYALEDLANADVNRAFARLEGITTADPSDGLLTLLTARLAAELGVHARERELIGQAQEQLRRNQRQDDTLKRLLDAYLGE